MKSYFAIFVLALSVGLYLTQPFFKKSESSLKLYWLIPDGLRSEPDLFKIYEWAQNNELPNIKKLMERGSYGYSIPVFPGHTPVNFATLLTGTYPDKNGVADGPMHTEGHTLDKVSVGGFRSSARWIPAVWTHLEELGHKVGIIAVPGSTPPEIQNGFVIRGRWGNWGLDLNSINVEGTFDSSRSFLKGRARKLFFFGSPLTIFTTFNTSEKNKNIKSESPILVSDFDIHDQKWTVTLYDETFDQKKNHDVLMVDFPGLKDSIRLREQEWSSWQDIQIKKDDIKLNTQVRLHAIKIDHQFYRLRIIFNHLNETLIQPQSLAKQLTNRLGPMIDFVDNFPPQLIDYEEDKDTFIFEQNQSFDWHRRSIPYLFEQQKPTVVIHNIYNPNQMLTSRWWLGSIDPQSDQFNESLKDVREQSWREVKDMYKKVDDMVGEVLKIADANTAIVLSSDHGVSALNTWVHLNNFFAKKGWLRFNLDPKTGDPIIDWKNSQVIYLKMDNIYIHPQGLDGPWKRASGKEYEELRQKVILALQELKGAKQEPIVVKITPWEKSITDLHLPHERVGDLIIANQPGFGWNEEVSSDLQILKTSQLAGYKQAILADENKALWTPFMIAGPGIKKAHAISQPVRHVDQLPTIFHSLKIKINSKMDGDVLPIFEK